jgi:hypothetical protein
MVPQKSMVLVVDHNRLLVAALRDAVALIDRLAGAGTGVSRWTVADVNRLKEIRLLSTGM